jgi:NAD(P)-dependent dehydrogenase (short-subunit alcohol dehydrogenase family)
MTSFDLTGKIAIVTGGSRGIGEACAKLLAKHGAHVVVASRKGAECEAAAQRIRDAGGKAEGFACHVGDLAQIDALWKHVEEKHGRCDIVVNNAGTNPHFGPLDDTTPEAFQKTIEVNLRGPFFMSMRAKVLMEKNSNGGAIVNVSSVNAEIPGTYQGVYSMTKAALISMTQACAKEWASLGIRVNAILPGITDTKLAAVIVHSPAVDALLTHVPMNRVAQPDEMAGAVIYLVSPAAAYTTGACIPIDGGYLTY